ncbi:hypothetical protein JHK82_034998 [Glycine max]|nr:hypothetical protein JHK85_035713 [Glycine max]KAG5111729.1 hypothetical protein JHK82_034998 [Glycine max]
MKRLYFHLENQQPVYWIDNQQIGEVLSKNTIKESILMPGDEVVLYYLFDDHAWELLIRKDIEWDNNDINFDD